MAHEWSYIKSSIKHQPQQTKGLRALKILYQLSCPIYGAKKVHQHPPCNELHYSLLTAVTIVIVHEKLSLTCSLSSFHAANPIHNQFLANIFSLEIYFLMLAPEVCTMAILYIHIYIHHT